MNNNIIILISEGRSGTNGLYRHLFANKMNKIEPFQNKQIGTKEMFSNYLKNNFKMLSFYKIIHIKPLHLWGNQNLPKLEYSDLIDACIEFGIKNFIVIKRKNILARIASNPDCSTNYKQTYNINPNKLLARLKKGHIFENNVINYLNKKNVNYVDLIYEEHIKKDINIACKIVVDKFNWLPNYYLTYKENAEDTKKLMSFQQNNNLLDKRPMYKRISNLDQIKPILKKNNSLWMLEY